MVDMNESEVIGMCICRQCPSWEDCEEKIGYCFSSVGKSVCIKDEKGCICPTCPVAEKMKLKHMYFCTRGSEKEQS